VPHPTSAGVLLFRQAPGTLRVLLAHPGGPYFSNKDAGAWSIPKGLVNPDENLADAARREFEEELGWRPDGELLPLGEVRLRSGKRLVAFALHCDDSEETLLAKFRPGTFTMEWPPRSGRTSEFSGDRSPRVFFSPLTKIKYERPSSTFARPTRGIARTMTARWD
jgi:predicted NUDIX family NTP pyrophosphohydrolase